MNIKHLPNILTLFRIFVIPIFVIVFYLPVGWAHLGAAIIFTLASITDWLDGYLARFFQVSSRLGEFLDPVADKLMVSIALVLIVGESQFQYVSAPTTIVTVPAAMLAIPAAVIVSREIVVSALREWMAEIGKRTSVAVSWLGKVKTFVQMLALIVLLYCGPAAHAGIIFIGYLLLYIAAVLTMWSMVIYLKAAWPDLRA
ncbi:MAG: CDP-diacylglycerol--glycerol-3-phosphate 3-phosphatidyltransferase [Gammaproteobacteria bacterium]